MFINSWRAGARNANALRVMALCGSAMTAIVWSGSAIAQTDDQAETVAEAPPATSGLERIVVTASRRETDQQRESRVIAAVGSDTLISNGITETSALQTLVPGLVIAPNGVQLQVFIRGVGDRSISFANDPSVAINVDGVYYPRAYEGGPQFYDLDRVEVLKGPQGTLYGRNATAGALNVITAKPVFYTEGFGEVEVGNYGLIRTTAALNAPIGENLAVRFSGQMIRRDGYLTDGYNDARSEAARVQFLFEPDPATSLLISGSYSHQGGMGGAAVIRDPVNFIQDPWTGPTEQVTRDRIDLTAGFDWLQDQPKDDGFQDIDTYTLTANFEHDFGSVVLNVLPSYIYSSLTTLSYAAIVVPGSFDTTSEQKSIEARLSSPSGSRINWVVGALASKEHMNDNKQSAIPFPGGVQDLHNISPRRDDTTWAVFGEANVSVTDEFRLIGGLRYTYEKKLVDGYGQRDLFYNTSYFDPVLGRNVVTNRPFPSSILPPRDYAGGGGAFGPLAAADASGQQTVRVVNFRAGFEYDVAPDSMLYATVATGFKAGGFYSDTSPNSYDPEHLTAFDFGIKNRFLDNRLQVNLEGFYWDYSDKQESLLSVGNAGGIILKTVNAGAVTLYGADLSVIGQVTQNDTLSFDVSYNHSNYDSFINVDIADGGITNCPFTGPAIGAPGTNNTTPRTYDCSGRPLARAAEWTGRVAFNHAQPLPGGSELVFNVQSRFSSSYFLSTDYTDVTSFGGFFTSDASLTWNSASEQLSLTAFVKNIEDEAIYTGATQSTAFGSLAMPGAVALISPPRTYGLRARVSF